VNKAVKLVKCDCGILTCKSRKVKISRTKQPVPVGFFVFVQIATKEREVKVCRGVPIKASEVDHDDGESQRTEL
jgi:hypothetical protein